MIHMKVIRLSDIIKVFAVAIAVFAAVVLVKLTPKPQKSYVQAFSQNNIQTEYDDIYKIIMYKAVPMFEASKRYNSDFKPPQHIINYMLECLARTAIFSPKTYLESQMPLLGIFNVPEKFTANVDAKLGTPDANVIHPAEAKTESNDNFDSIPVKNPNLDYNKPAVVIFHTHTTESYTPTEKFTYVEEGGVHRTRDKSFDVCRVGEEIKNYLEQYYGLAVVHDTTIHDYPSFDASYKRSRVTVESLVKKYPEAKIYIDLHRDAEVPKDKITADIKGDKAAKVMFVIGKGNPHWQENYQLSQKINQKIEDLYPTLARTIDVKMKSIYNQDISNRMVLLEVGGDTNTLEEAIVSAKMIGKAIGQMLDAL